MKNISLSVKEDSEQKKEAQVAALDIEMRLQKGTNVLTKNKSFAAYFEYWIDKYKSDSHPNTYKRYKDSLNRVKTYFADMPIQKINIDSYTTFLSEYASTRSTESVRKLNTHIRACVSDAIDEGYISIDFTKRAQITGAVAAKKAREKYINYEDSKRLYKYLIKNASCTSDYLILFGLITGFALGKLLD